MAETWQTIEQAAVSLRLSVRTVNRHIVAGKLQSRLNEGRREVLVNLPDAAAAQPAPSNPPASFTFDAQVSDAASAVTDSAATAGANESSTTTSPFSQAPSPPVSVDPETVLALADNAAQKAELAVTAYQTLARYADTEVRQMRRNTRVAWSAVTLMAIGVSIAIGWTTHRLTRASVERDYLQDQLLASNDTARKLSADQDKLRQEHAESERAIRAELTSRVESLANERATAEQALRGEVATAKQDAARAEGQLAAYKEQAEAREIQERMLATATTASATISESSVPPILTLEASDAAPSKPTTQPIATKSIETKVAAPTTRQSTLRRKAPQATTRASTPTDTSSASTAEERAIR